MPSTSGAFEQVDGHPIIRFERTFPHPVQAVWESITDPAKLRDWSPTTVEFSSLARGETIDFRFETHDLPPMTGEIRDVEEPCRFAFTWGEDELTFELAEAGGGAACRLTFSVMLDSAGKAARDGAGWERCLDALGLVASGRDVSESLPEDAWKEYYEAYKNLGFPATAEIPG